LTPVDHGRRKCPHGPARVALGGSREWSPPTIRPRSGVVLRSSTRADVTTHHGGIRRGREL